MVQGEVDDWDAEMEQLESATANTGGMSAEAGHFPLNKDPLGEKFLSIISDCVEKWKANQDDAKKSMWECFDKVGVFVLIC